MSMVSSNVEIHALKSPPNSIMPPISNIYCQVLEQGFTLMFGANKSNVHHANKQVRGSTPVDP
jgi:hypothetical protein